MERKRLSPWEAKENLKEMRNKIGQEHAIEVENKIADAIYEQIFFDFGETLEEEIEFSDFCERILIKDP